MAVSITLPPPTLETKCQLKLWDMGWSGADAREEVAEVMLPCPCNGSAEAVLGGLCENIIVDLEGEVGLRLQRGEGLC